MTLTMDLQNVQQKMVCYGVYYGERIETGTSINSRWKILNQVFVIIQMHIFL